MKYYIYAHSQEPDTTYYWGSFTFKYVIYWFNTTNSRLHYMTRKGWQDSMVHSADLDDLQEELRNTYLDLQKVAAIIGYEAPK